MALQNTAPKTWVPYQWDHEAGVVIVGFGAAGAAAAITVQDAGVSVLMLEKAPEGHEGGNTRVAGQGYLNASPVDDAIAYFKAMAGPYAVPDEMIQVWAEEGAKNNDWVKSIGGDPQEHQHPPEGIEFPELPGANSIHGTSRSALKLPASSSMLPRLGRGGCMPRPKKLSMISVPMSTPMPMETVTTIGLMALDST